MLRFFNKTRNITGLILVISPLFGFLFIDKSFDLSMVSLCCLIPGIALASSCYELFPFRIWTAICAVLSVYGAFLMFWWAYSPLTYIGAGFLGLGSGGFFAVVPSNFIINWFRASKTSVMAIVWFVSVLLGIIWKSAMERYTYYTLVPVMLSMFAGIFFFLERPPRFLSHGNSITGFSLRKKSIIKVCVFVFIIGFVSGIAGAMVYENFIPQNSGFQNSNLQNLPSSDMKNSLVAGMVAGPVISGVFTNKKGIYSGCILTIFLGETSIMLCEYSSAYKTAACLSMFIIGLCISSMQVIIPILVFYLYGPADYNISLGYVALSLPSGLLSSAPFAYYSFTRALPRDQMLIWTFFLLIISFFTIFSAWKHRLVLLKA